MPAKQCWRLLIRYTGQQSIIAINDIEMALVNGGANQCAGGTAFGNGGGTYADAFDGNTGTDWTGFNLELGNRYIGYDFGAGNTKDITSIRIRPNGGFGLDRTPYIWQVEYADSQAGPWTVDYYATYNAWVVGTFVTFDRPAPAANARYWAVFPDTCQTTNQFGVAEFEMRTVIGGANVVAGGAGNAYNTLFSASIAGAYDGNINTYYANDSGCNFPKAGWLSYDFGAGNNKAIVEVVFVARNDANFGWAPVTGFIGYSTDGKAWINSFSFTGLAYAGAGSSQTASGALPTVLAARCYQITVIVVSKEIDLPNYLIPFNLGGIVQGKGRYIQT